MNDETADRLITALNNVEESVEELTAAVDDTTKTNYEVRGLLERLSTAIEHWEVVHTARDPDASITADEAMSGDVESDEELVQALADHYEAQDLHVDLEEIDGKIYVSPREFVGGDTFRQLFAQNGRMNYDEHAPKGKQNWIEREDVRGYIRETS